VPNLKGTLYVVATPIGNLQDLSPRAQAILREVTLIVAEDTRHSRHLLTHFGITTSLQSLHEHNEHKVAPLLLQRLQAGDNLALISDAGTPLISDPGHYLLEMAHTQSITVVPIPGPSAIISALSVAGFPADRFVFEGFLPAKATARQQQLTYLAQEPRTLVFYEAPHRILDCIRDMKQIFGEQRLAVVIKELTKRFETIYRSTLTDLLQWLAAQPERQKGEFVIVVQGAPPPDNQTLDLNTKRIFNRLRQDLPLKQAAQLTSEITGISKNILYNFGLGK
jgi:16S rRNA (cytidine1402-2'-O)-methyltransferase